MSKFPLLEQMRAERQRREDEVTAPYKAEILTGARVVASLQRRLREVEKALGSEIAKHITAELAHDLGAKLRQLIAETLAKAGRAVAGVTITLPRDVVFLDPRSFESEIMRRYTAETLPRLSLCVDDGPIAGRMTVLDISLPELRYRRDVVELC